MAALLALCCVVALTLPGLASAAPVAHSLVIFEPKPVSLATDKAGDVYLSDPAGSTQVQKFSSNGTLLGAWGEYRQEPDDHFHPRALAVDPAGEVYVADSLGGQIGVYSPGGSLIRQWSATYRDIAIDAAGDLYVLHDSRVEKRTPGGSLIAQWGGGGEYGALGEPWGIDVAPGGNVYVADSYANRILIFSPGGTFVGQWGSPGTAPGQVRFPYALASDPSGNIWVTEPTNHRVQEFNSSGVYLGTIGSPGPGPGQFNTPTAIATDRAGNVYVADATEPFSGGGRVRIQKFGPDGKLITQWAAVPAPRPARPRITAAPPARTGKNSATFRFRSDQEGIEFQCRLSGERVPMKLRRWRACSSPKHYTRLTPGKKLFRVRAIEDGVAGPAARRSWRIVDERGRR